MGNARRCLTCKVLFETIDASNDHCASTTHPLNAHQCRPCNRAFATASALQSHLDSRLHLKRTKIGQSATHSMPAIYATEADKALNCFRCELTFDNHELLLEHYRTSSMHRFCLVCFQVFPSKELLDQHMKALRHSENRVLRIPKPKKKKKKPTTSLPISLPPKVNLPGVLPTESASSRPALLDDDDDDLILIEKSSLVPCTAQTQTQTPVITIPQTKNTNTALSTRLISCPGCQKQFYLFAAFVLHIEIEACSSASKSRQINADIDALAAQFHKLSII